jgi:hypothetical protein
MQQSILTPSPLSPPPPPPPSKKRPRFIAVGPPPPLFIAKGPAVVEEEPEPKRSRLGVQSKEVLTWITSPLLKITLPVYYASKKGLLPDIASLSRFFQFVKQMQPKPITPTTPPVTVVFPFGPNDEVVFTGLLSDTGVDAFIFNGTISSGTSGRREVVLKVARESVAHVCRKQGCKVASTKEEDARFDDIIREYDMMSHVQCDLSRGGPIICTYGSAAIVLGENVYVAIALEKMDASASHYIETFAALRDRTDAFIMAIVIVLKALKNIRRLHAAGYMHMDSHAGNWLIKIGDVTKPMYMDVRMSDMGRSCVFDDEVVRQGKEPVQYKCAEMSKRGGIYADFAYYNIVEYAQFINMVTLLFGIVTDVIPADIDHMLIALVKQYEAYHRVVYTYRVRTTYNKAPFANWTFEDFVRDSNLEIMLGWLVWGSGLFADEQIRDLEAQDLLPTPAAFTAASKK